MYINVVRNFGREEATSYRAMLDRVEFTTTYAAERVAEYLRGILADAFHAGQAEASLDTIREIESEQLASLTSQRDEWNALAQERGEQVNGLEAALRERLAERDTLAETLDQMNATNQDLEANVSRLNDLNTNQFNTIQELTAERDQARDQTTDQRIEELDTQLRDARFGIEQRDNQLAEKDRRIEHLQSMISQYGRTIDIIGDRLIQEANDRDWCSDYDRVVDEINRSIPIGQLPLRKENHNGQITLDFSELPIGHNEDADSRVSEIAATIYRFAQREYPNIFDDWNYTHESE